MRSNERAERSEQRGVSFDRLSRIIHLMEIEGRTGGEDDISVRHPEALPHPRGLVYPRTRKRASLSKKSGSCREQGGAGI